MEKFYLDDAATTGVRKETVEAMKPFFLEEYGNPSSLHEMGENAEKALNEARKKFAKELNCKPSEIYFTSGATESNNMALRGLLKLEKKKIIISSIEHPSIKEVANFLKEVDVKVMEISVDKEGIIDLGKLEKEIDKNSALVSVIHVNNIVGCVQDLNKIGKICKKKSVLFHTDATQSFGKLNIDVKSTGIDMLSASAHKIGGPKGIGLLYVRDGVKLEPIIIGGGQERGFRSGTENVPGIIGFANALEICKRTNKDRIIRVRNKFIMSLEKIGGHINGSKEKGVHDIINVSFPGVNNETLVVFLSHKGIYVSAGSACDNKKDKEDHVLRALGLSKKEINGSIRITVNENLTEKDVSFIIKEIDKSVRKLRV